jgi:WD40 repeat protein/serine/threonine protein kinase
MHILCPHCHNPIEVVKISVREEITCPSCGSSFHLETDTTTDLANGSHQNLGRFELTGVLGHGAFGTVYKARDPELDRTVALKVPRAGDLAGSQERDRFLREARSAAQLRHPSIVTVHEVGQQDGLPYLVSEFVQGVTLADLLSARRPGFREAAELVAAVADALHYAHKQGVVHRDVKPSNIMIGDDGRPCVMDFGLAKRDAGEITMTVEGQVLGTPAYMSPEQARGQGHAVDGRGDVYSLGVVLYQLLTGDLPFRGSQRMLFHQVLHDEPRSPRGLNDCIPRDLETICLKAMAKEPRRRYQTARELGCDLRRFLQGEPIQARPVSTWERGIRWARRQPALAGLLAVSGVAVLALSVVVTALLYNAQLKQSLQQSERAKEKAEAATLEAEKTKYFLRIARAHAGWRDGNMSQMEPLLDECPPAQRNWEWHYLKRLCHADLLTLRGHASWIWRVLFSPDGRQLASVSADRTVRTWDASTGELTRRLEGGVRPLAFSPDGKRLAAGMEGTVTIWELATGKRETFLEEKGWVSSVAFSPDGRLLASGGREDLDGPGVVKVWDAQQKRDALWKGSSPDNVFGVAFNPDGTRLAWGDWGGHVSICPLIRDKDAVISGRVNTWKGHEAEVRSIAFSPDGSLLASAGGEGTVKLWESSSGRPVSTSLVGHTSKAEWVAFSPDGFRLACSGWDGSVRIWDVKTGREILVLRAHSSTAVGLSFSPDGIKLASGGGNADATVKVWDAATDPAIRLTIRGQPNSTMAAVFSQDGERLVAAGTSGQVNVWDATTAQRVPLRMDAQVGRVSCFALSSNGTRLATGGADGLRIRDVTTNQVVLSISGRPWTNVRCLAFAADCQRLVSADSDKSIRIIEVTTGKQLMECKDEGDGKIDGLVFNPDATQVAAFCGDGTARVWSVATGQLLFKVRHTAGGQAYNALETLAYSSDGKRLATGGQADAIKIWDALTGKELLALRGDYGGPRRVAFNPDGSRIVSGSYDGSVKVWDTTAGQELLTLKLPAQVESVGFSSDGTQLFAAGADGTIRIWDGRPLSAETPGRREALGLLRSLFSKPLCKEDVINYVTACPTITPEARKLALELAARYHDETDPERYHQTSWALARQPHLNAIQYRFALRQAETACRLAPEQTVYQTNLAAAQYRVGQYREAIETLTRSGQANQGSATDLAFLAMAQYRLKQTTLAKATLTRLREAVQNPERTRDEQFGGFLREAEGLIEGMARGPEK